MATLTREIALGLRQPDGSVRITCIYTSIDNEALAASAVISVYIPDSIRITGKQAFNGIRESHSRQRIHNR